MKVVELLQWAKRYDPKIASSVRGASEKEIDALAAAAQSPFPTEYREFLALMGADASWITPPNTRFDVAALSEHYKLTDWRPPGGYLKIGLADQDPFFDPYLKAEPGNKVRVVRMPRGPIADFQFAKKAYRFLQASNLVEYLGTSIYRRRSMATRAYAERAAAHTPVEGQLAEFVAAARDEGFAVLPFASDWVQVLERGDIGLIVRQFPKSVLAVDIAGDDASAAGRLIHTLAAEFQLPHRFERAAVS